MPAKAAGYKHAYKRAESGEQLERKTLRKDHNMDQKKIDRINTLYHKSQSVGLTEEEKEEQARLRREYIAAIRGSLRASLNNISIQEKDGSITDLGKKYGQKHSGKPS